jgi:hypothetical protein
MTDDAVTLENRRDFVSEIGFVGLGVQARE